SKLTKVETLRKKETKRDAKNPPGAERLHTRNHISDWTPGRNNMNAPSVTKHVLDVLIFQVIKAYTPEKSPISAVYVVGPLVKCLLSRHTRGSILGKSLISAIHVGRRLVNCLLSRHTR